MLASLATPTAILNFPHDVSECYTIFNPQGQELSDAVVGSYIIYLRKLLPKFH